MVNVTPFPGVPCIVKSLCLNYMVASDIEDKMDTKAQFHLQYMSIKIVFGIIIVIEFNELYKCIKIVFCFPKIQEIEN